VIVLFFNRLATSIKMQREKGRKSPVPIRPWLSRQCSGKTQASSGLMFSSMAMSLNSLDSKTSPHSWHSTNSASSSRATTRTRGCLQDFSIGIGSGGRFEIDGFCVEFIFGPRRVSARACSRIGGILSLSGRMSSASARHGMPYSRKWMIKAPYGVAAKAWDKCLKSGLFPP